jgi:hypothetical protein
VSRPALGPTTFCGPTLNVAILHPPQKFEYPPLWNDLMYGIEKYGVEIIIDGMTSLLNSININKLVQKSLRETHGQIDRSAIS